MAHQVFGAPFVWPEEGLIALDDLNAGSMVTRLGESGGVRADLHPALMGRRLESYILQDLALRYWLLAAYLEFGGKGSLDQIHRRLCDAGRAVLPAQIETARRGLLHCSPQGDLSGIVSSPQWRETLEVLRLHLKDYRPRAAEPQVGGWALESQPLARQELEDLLEAVGPFDGGFLTPRRQFMLFLDSRGGQAGRDELLQDYLRFSSTPTQMRADPQRHLRDALHSGTDDAIVWDRSGETVRLLPQHPRVLELRRKFRIWMARQLARLDLPRVVTPTRPEWQPTAVVASLRWHQRLAVILDCRNGEVRRYRDAHIRFRRDLESFALLVGFSPRSDLRQLGLTVTIPTLELLSGRASRWSTWRRMAATTGVLPNFVTVGELRALAETDSEAVLDQLEVQARGLFRYYHYGAIHGYIVRSHQRQRVLCPVDWNRGQQPLLEQLGSLCGQPTRVNLWLRKQPSQPLEVQVIRLLDQEVEIKGQRKRLCRIRVDDILDLRILQKDPVEIELARELTGKAAP